MSLTRIANAIFHLSAFARFPVLHGKINCLSMFDLRNNLSGHGQIDSMTELNDYYQNHRIMPFVKLISIL